MAGDDDSFFTSRLTSKLAEGRELEKLKAKDVQDFAHFAERELAPTASELADALRGEVHVSREGTRRLLDEANGRIKSAAVYHDKTIVATGIAERIEAESHEILKVPPSALPARDREFLAAAGSRDPKRELASTVRKSRLAYFERVERPRPQDVSQRLRNANLRIGSDSRPSHRERVFKIARKLVLALGYEAVDLAVLVEKNAARDYGADFLGAWLSVFAGWDQIIDASNEDW